MVDTAIFSIFHRAPAPPPPAPEPVEAAPAPQAAPALDPPPPAPEPVEAAAAQQAAPLPDPAPPVPAPELAVPPSQPSVAAHEPVAADPAAAEIQHVEPMPDEAAPAEAAPVEPEPAETVAERIEGTTDHPEIPVPVAHPVHVEPLAELSPEPTIEPEAVLHPPLQVEPSFEEPQAALPTVDHPPEPENAPESPLEQEYLLQVDEQAFEGETVEAKFVPEPETVHEAEPAEEEQAEPVTGYAGAAEPDEALPPEAEPEFRVDPSLVEPPEEPEEVFDPEAEYAEYGVDSEPELPFGMAEEVVQPPQPPRVALWADPIATPEDGTAGPEVGLEWQGPAELTGIPVEADQLGLANPIIITLHARLRDFSSVELDASQSGIYRPQTFRAAPWSGFAYDQAMDGRTGFAAGTRILTARGEMEVERLLPGDTALALRAPALLPIAWIGKSVATAAPVWIEAGALGPNLPRRALCLAPDQPIYLEPVPVPAQRLVNGTTIRIVETEDVDIFHVDLGKSEILFAEGVPLSSSDRARLQRA